MFKIMLALHLLAAIFAIGPLVGAATTASRGLRTADGSATASAARTLTIYGYASIVVVFFGFGLMSAKDPHTHKVAGDMGDVWIWLSIVIWLVTLGLLFGVVVPALKQATNAITGGSAAGSLGSATGKVAACGGVIALLYAVIVFLMVYRPGS
ncbi:MAG: hypothetical protein FWD95_16635 [Nocardioidaceae bacterium]|nr:hypothetical protein [Nocardioidaceae bacterium]